MDLTPVGALFILALFLFYLNWRVALLYGLFLNCYMLIGLSVAPPFPYEMPIAVYFLFVGVAFSRRIGLDS